MSRKVQPWEKVQSIKHLPGMHKALSSVPGINAKKKKVQDEYDVYTR